MRLLAGLVLLATTPALADPQKDQLPAGATARLGAAATPTSGEPRSSEIHALNFIDNATLFVGSAAGWTVWDLEKRQRRQDKLVGGPVFAIARDADRLYVGSTRKLHVIEPVQSATAEPARTWDVPAESVGILALAAGGRRLFLGGGDAEPVVLDTHTGKSTGTIELTGRPVAAALTANGRVLAVVNREGAARAYNLGPTGMLESLWSRRVARSEHVAAGFSPDGRLFAVSSAGRVMLLECVTGRSFLVLERRFGESDVRTVAFSADGRLLAVGSGGAEPVVRVWQVDNGQDLASYTGHSGNVNAVAFSPDGKLLASAGSDGSVLLWSVPGARGTPKPMTVTEAWYQLDALDSAVAYAAMGSLLGDPGHAVKTIADGLGGIPAEQARIRRWIAELDHDEFRVREAARRSLLKTGLRGAASLTDPGRKKMGPEGEQRVQWILEALESRGLRVPESGLFGESLRSVRAVRVLETIGGKEARGVLKQVARGPGDDRLTKEAKAALQTLPAGN